MAHARADEYAVKVVTVGNVLLTTLTWLERQMFGRLEVIAM